LPKRREFNYIDTKPLVIDSGVLRAAIVDVDDLGKAVVLEGARKEKRRAARRSRLAVSKKSPVFPSLSTAVINTGPRRGSF
jgi:2-phospho-L-lactate guanylyltransferase (CobY/MobA/RfbA family)